MAEWGFFLLFYSAFVPRIFPNAPLGASGHLVLGFGRDNGGIPSNLCFFGGFAQRMIPPVCL